MAPARLKLVALALAGAAVLACFAALAFHYHPFFSDDGFISLRYAKRWVEGHGLTWTDGERVEGYTDFLWVVLNAAGGWLGFGYIATARTLGFVGGVVALAALGVSLEPRRVSLPRLVIGGGLFASSAPFAIWAVGGLEQALMAGVLAVGLRALSQGEGSATERQWLSVAGVAFAALALLRADGAVLVAAASLALWCTPRPSRGRFLRAVRLALPTAGALAAQLAFRRSYYGDWQPNTAYVKVAFTLERLQAGSDYVRSGFLSAAVLLVAALGASVRAWRGGRARTLAVPWAIVVVWSLYLSVVGGDIFPGFRQLIPALVPLCFIAGDEFAARWEAGELASARAVPLAVLLVAANGVVQFRNPENRRAKEERWEWDGSSMGRTLRTAFGKHAPLHAVDAAGALPYFTGFPSLDLLGLNDRHIARTRPAGFGKGFVGHELGDGAYVLRRAPDLLSFNWPAGTWDPELLSGRELLALPEFRAKYQWIRVASQLRPPVVGEIWIRREGGKLGVSRSDARIEVPGYFATGQASDAAAELEAGALVARLSDAAPGVLPAFEVPRGRFRLSVVPESNDFVFDVRCGERSMLRTGAAEGAPVFELERAERLTIALSPRARSQTASVRALALSRESGAAAAWRCGPVDEPLVVPELGVQAEQLAPAFAAHPQHRAFDQSGIAVDTQVPPAGGRIAVVVSGHSGYELSLVRAGEVISTHSLKKRKEPGLSRHEIELDEPLAPGPVRLLLKPRRGKKGDAAVSPYYLGYLGFERPSAPATNAPVSAP